jgi:hypothetical protein
VSVLKTGFDNPVVWTGGPEERKLHESGFNSIQQSAVFGITQEYNTLPGSGLPLCMMSQYQSHASD